MEKREDHPLWNEFSKHMEACKPEQAPGYWHYHWQDFLAGAEAAKAQATPPGGISAKRMIELVALLDVPPFETALGCLTNAVERLEELAEKPTPMELSHVANRFNAGIKQLEELSARSAGLCDRMEKIVASFDDAKLDVHGQVAILLGGKPIV